jgi:DNA modification methylase
MDNALLLGDCREVLKTLPDESVHCVVTSPPYFGLRSYLPDGHPHKAREIGLEETPEAFVAALVEVFREVRRVLRGDGVCWLNLGDSYSVQHVGRRDHGTGDKTSRLGPNKDGIPGGTSITANGNRLVAGLKPKDLIGIPWRVAFALQADGWYLRQDIIWSKPNPMPESVTDRCTKSHEYVFLLSKNSRYWYDAEAVKEGVSEATAKDNRTGRNRWQNGGESDESRSGDSRKDFGCMKYPEDGKRNRRSVWTVATQPYSEAHFATFPPALIEPMILAGCPAQACEKCGKGWERVVEREGMTTTEKRKESGYSEKRGMGGIKVSQNLDYKGGHGSNIRSSRTLGHRPACACEADSIPGTVLDPFFGSGTVGQVAERLGRRWIGIDLNDGYTAMQQKRTAQRGLALGGCHG